MFLNPWWLPTKQEQHQYLTEDALHYDEEIPKRLKLYLEETEKLNQIEADFIESLTEEQQDKWLKFRTQAQKVQLSYQTLNYAENFRKDEYEKRLNSIYN